VLTPAVTVPEFLGFRDAVVSECVGALPSRDRCNISFPQFACKRLGSYNHNLANLQQAVERRVFTVEDKINGGFRLCPKPVPRIWDSMWQYGKRVADMVRSKGVKRLTAEAFLAQCPRHNMAAYRKALDSARLKGVQRCHSWIFPFVKNEKVDVTKACRLISPRHKVYNVELGRFTRAIEEEVYRAIGRAWGDVEHRENTVAKGMTVEQVAWAMRQKWLDFDDPVGVGLDASRFDQHVSREALVWEHGVYLSIFNENKYLRKLLHMQLENKFVVKMDGQKFEFEVDGTRMSGDMNTALGNCLIMSMLVLAWCESVGVRARLINNGDDCVVFMERADYDRFMEGLPLWFEDRGFEMKVEEPVDVFERLEFCQMKPVWAGKWVMVRNIDAALTKDTMALGVVDRVGLLRWIHAVGTCGWSLYGDIPIYNSLYAAMMRNGVASSIKFSSLFDNSGLIRLGKRPRIRIGDSVQTRDATRLSFQRAFGITVQHQREVESYLDAWHGVGEVRTGMPLYAGLHHVSLGK